MKMKRNLTLAVALGLLAVPALNSNNISNNLHIPSITANADGTLTDGTHTNDGLEANTGSPGLKRWNKVPGVDEDQYNSSFNKAVGAVGNSNYKTGAPITVNRNGHTITVVPEDDVPGKIISVDGQSVSSASQVLSLLHGNRSLSNDSSNNNQQPNSNTGTQYSNNKKTLPQTSEINNQTKRIATSIILGATGIGLGAFTFEKDKNQNKLATINTTSDTSSNNGKNEIDYLLDNIKNGTDKLNNYVSKINSES